MEWLTRGVWLAIGNAILAFVLGVLGLGCQNQQTYDQTLATLQQGKARGHLVVTTDGKLGFGASQTFFGGANAGSLSFDGDVDFADSVRHVSDVEQ